MNILIIGNGGREHAFAWKLAQSKKTSRIFVAPGNAGTSRETGVTNVALTDIADLVAFAKQEQVGLTLVGPEAPLAAGVVNAFEAEGLRIFGPTRQAAQLESSKAFAKAFMERHHIPTAKAAVFTHVKDALAYVEQHGAPIVIKADGLAAGKGVVVAETLEDARRAVTSMLSDKTFGDAGARVVIEEFLKGEEASFIVMVDGEHILPLATSQDHKRLRDNDEGENTGGMGAYSPAPVITPKVHARVMREIILPTIKGLAEEGIRFKGFLYAGLMIDESGAPKTLEFNCRMGDPETQPMMMRMKTDFFVLLDHAVQGRLNEIECEWNTQVALGIVLAAEGYPAKPVPGAVIEGLDKVGVKAVTLKSATEIKEQPSSDEVKIFHAGTRENAAGEVTVSGGRVLCVTALGVNVKAAQQRALAVADEIAFKGKQMRRDIGNRAILRK
ncbi:MAG: phosphoribosylamine--glycine ligase [Burkholderiales bacterium]|jgi:phosphoribosylamine--glycine ligase|nr:phosphoribosylamine--glycine ligase [Burkholderiales bacterium]